jgi:hypothetical protein
METSPRPEECAPVQFHEAEAGFGSESRILPGDYSIVAVSSNGRRASGMMRLFQSSPADSGRSPYTGEWVHATPDDRIQYPLDIQYPLYGVTTVDFEQTSVKTDASLEALAREVNPVFPEVLVERRGGDTREDFSWILLVDTIQERTPLSGLDGGGVWLSVEQLEAGFFRGEYDRYGIIHTDQGFYCAWRQSDETSNPVRLDKPPR